MSSTFEVRTVVIFAGAISLDVFKANHWARSQKSRWGDDLKGRAISHKKEWGCWKEPGKMYRCGWFFYCQEVLWPWVVAIVVVLQFSCQVSRRNPHVVWGCVQPPLEMLPWNLSIACARQAPFLYLSHLCVRVKTPQCRPFFGGALKTYAT